MAYSATITEYFLFPDDNTESSFALSKTSRSDENKAYHLIQSFLPGEVDFDTAHQIGMELADKVLEGKYSYVVSTHIDKDHIHNHVIFCAADNIDHHKYNDCKKSYYRIRHLSDELCREHHLSVIVPDGQRGKKYNEWSADKHSDSRKSELRRDINAAIRSADTYDEFLHLLRSKGYVVKGENLDGKSSKYISFLPPSRERFVRGSVKSLGAEYTKERIAERISERVQNRGKPLTVGYTGKRLIDTSQEKFQESAGLKRWAEIENLKTATSAYNKVNSIADLEKKIAECSASAKSNREKLTILERKMKSMAEIIKYAQQYQENRPYQIRYRKAKNPDDYFRKHETELILYDGAKEMLRVILSDPALTVLESTPQYAGTNPQGRSVILDAKCVLGDGRKTDIEVQKANDTDHQRRVRYNGAILTTNLTDPGEKFENIPDVCVVFISRFDIFDGNHSLYHVDRIIRETGKVVDNGFEEVYVNAKVKDGSEVSELMEVFVDDAAYNSKFPVTSGSKRRYKTTEEGQQVMCEIMERIAKEERNEGRLEGRLEGETRINTLNAILINLNRFDDLKRAATDKDFQMQLMIELLPEDM